jgi:hypothetical protein
MHFSLEMCDSPRVLGLVNFLTHLKIPEFRPID